MKAFMYRHWSWVLAAAFVGGALAPAVVVSGAGWMIIIESWLHR